MRAGHIQQQPRRTQERRLGIHLVAHGDRQREKRPRMVVQPDPRLAQHAQERLLGAELRMVVAADVRHPARRLAQPPRLAGLGGKQRIGPAEQRRRQVRVAPQPRRQLAAGGEQRILARGSPRACAA